MSTYRKVITISSTGQVFAEIYYGNRRCGLNAFGSIFDSKETRFKKAHQWADAHIDLCRKWGVV